MIEFHSLNLVKKIISEYESDKKRPLSRKNNSLVLYWSIMYNVLCAHTMYCCTLVSMHAMQIADARELIFQAKVGKGRK